MNSQPPENSNPAAIQVVHRICLMAPSAGLGGAERAVLDLALEIKGEAPGASPGFTPWVLVPGVGPLAEELKSAGIEFDVLAPPQTFTSLNRESPLMAFQLGLRSIPGMGLYLAKLAILLRKRRPAVIHTFGVWCHGIAGTIGPIGRIPIVWFLRDIFEEGPTLWTLRTLQKTAAIQVVAASRSVAESYSAHDARIPVIHPGIPLTEGVTPSRNEEVRVGIVGSLKKAKGQEDFVAMASLLQRKGVKAKFVLAGHRPPASALKPTDAAPGAATYQGFEKELRTLVERLGLQDYVEFTGFKANLVESLRTLDILVYCARPPEGASRVLVEAQAAGVAVVASRAGVALDFIDDQKNGLTFEPGKIGDMAEKVERLIADPELRAKLVETGKRYYQSRWTPGKNIAALRRIYENMIRFDDKSGAKKKDGDKAVLLSVLKSKKKGS